MEGVETRFQYVYDQKLFALATFFDPTTKDLMPAAFKAETFPNNILKQVQN